MARRGANGCLAPPAVLAAAVLILASACDPWPRDPEGTLERARGGVLRVGASEAPPLLLRGADSDATGPEAELVEAFADTIGARIEWRWGATDELLHELERYELDVVAGGLTVRSPWKRHVALTRPWLEQDDEQHVLAVAPGENAMLVALERSIERRRAERNP